MNIQLQFKNITDQPCCRIMVNDHVLFDGHPKPRHEFDLDIPPGTCTLTIVHYDKSPEDTVVENDIIVRDRSFELERCVIDGYDLQELVWNSKFVADDGNVYASCLFFGPNGQFQLAFENPVLWWILHSRHQRDNNDPHWQEDYEYYQQACNRLKQISIK